VDLALSDDQRLLQDSIHRFLSDRYGAEQRRQSVAAAAGWSREMWQAIVDLGWLAIAVPEECGGLGGGGVELCLLAEALGRALVVEPVLDVLLMARLTASLGAIDWVAQLLDGRCVAVLAHQEGARVLSMAVRTRAEHDGSGWVLSGHKDFVLAGPGADIALVTARVGSELGVFAVGFDSEGLGVEPFDTVDGRRACRITLNGVTVPPEGRLGNGDASAAIEEMLDAAAIALAAEAVGCMDALLAATVDYTRTREQFGRPLAANQVLRHRMADMSVACEEARGIALRGALMLSEAPPMRSRAASAAKFKTAHAGRAVAESAIQLHGGMGVTEELQIGLYAKRLLAIDLSFGTGAHHLRRHAALRGHTT
jgi:alkylation response protein AidB-like acyl-CoA dehydrogenase